MIYSYKALVITSGLILCYFFLFQQTKDHQKSLTNFIDAVPSQSLINENAGTASDNDSPQNNNPINISEYLSSPIVQAFRTLQYINFEGKWTLRDEGNNNHEFFQSSTGKVQMNVYNDLPTRKSWNQFVIIDGEYFDDRLYTMKLSDTIMNTFNPTTLTYEFKDKKTNISEYDTMDVQRIFECTVNIKGNLEKIIQKDTSEEGSYVLDESAPVEFEITSDCGLNLNIIFYKDNTDYQRKTVNYSILLTSIAIVNLYTIARMIRIAIESLTEANKISMLTIGFITVWDTYICLAHLFFALSRESLFHVFIMPTFWYFILFSIFEVKLLIIVWRARYFQHYENFDVIRRAAVAFYCKLYSAMFITLFLFFKYAYHNWFLLLTSLYLVPQIIHNALRGGRVDFNPNYMFLVIGTRVILPLYFKGCPVNLLQIKPSLPFCIALIFIVGSQILIVYYQSVHGSKFFIPSRFLPPQYDYLHSLPEDLEAGLASQDDCAVCMNALSQDPHLQDTQNTHARLLLNRLKPRRGQIMKTPCNHKFHVTCLVEWMSIKMECPTCRAPLPVLD